MSFSDSLREECAALWEAQHDHPFVRGIGDGSLAEDRFRWFIRQDYLYLIDYGRLLALGAARAPRLEEMRRFSQLCRSVLETEMTLHRGLAEQWGVGRAELESERLAPATASYVDFLLRTAMLGDYAELVAALLPCMWGYAEIGERLARAGITDHPRYAAWIATYADPEFGELAAWARGLTDRAAADQGPGGRDRMRAAFARCSEHELAFFDAAWNA